MRFTKNNRGLSDIITTVLIILLVLAAIVLIWSFIRPSLLKAGKQIETGSDCLQLQLVPVTCTYNDVTHATKLVYKWSEGQGNLKGSKLIVDLTGGTNNVTTLSTAPTFLSTDTKILTYSVNPTKLSVAAVVAGSDGTLVTCQQSVAVDCTIDTGVVQN